MNKSAFINRLKQCLKHLPKEDREDAIHYYTEYFEEMGADENEDVTISLGKPEDIAKEIIANCTEKHINTQKEDGGIKNSATAIWMIILTIFATPIAIPLALVAVTVLFILLIVLLCIIFSIACTGIAFTGSGIVVFISTFYTVGIAQKLICIGLAFLLTGVGILLLIATILLGELCIRGIAAIYKKLFIRRKIA